MQVAVALVLTAASAQVDSGAPLRIMSGVVAGSAVLVASRKLGWQAAPQRGVRELALAVVGLGIGGVLAVHEYRGDHTVLYLAVAVGMIAAGVLVGWWFHRVTGLDRLSAMLAMVPGGMAAMTGAAAERGRDAATVSAVQAMRMFAAVVLVTVAAVAGPASAGPGPDVSCTDQPWNFIQFVGALVLVWPLACGARRLRLPLPAFFAGIAIGVSMYVGQSLFSSCVGIPSVVTAAGQILLGVSVGESIVTGMRRGRLLALGALGVAMTLSASLMVAAVVHAVTGLDWLTCVLMTAPGGAPEVTMFALALPVEIDVVLAAQLARQLLINIGLPFWLWLFIRLDRGGSGARDEEAP
ncbi:AbrB family transcriptional regulator [Lentzea waywayandensis]|uniref:AbrB family transcriptional regulator n=1 Tax=Lentzea waywayandensis TaxID=84724 RepID=UPI000B8A4BD2|nr:AbrB family transcriptional regulator [Lentzea waywayandensis]